MQESIDIGWAFLLLFSLTLCIPLYINRHFQLGLAKDTLISVSRMCLQLILVGAYLEFVFELNSLLLNIFWVLIMASIGTSAIIDKAKLPLKPLFLPVLSGLLIGLSPIIIVLCVVIVQPTPVYSSQYVIPLCGMLIGNSMNANIIMLQNLFSAFKEREGEYHAALSLGASPTYASLPFVRTAMQKAWSPILASMATIGLVTLPGMMTGQILGGTSPLVAIKYQLIIMIAIFVMMTISLSLSTKLGLRSVLSKEGRVLVSTKR
ncbi:ABC transporter permease [Vibrio penaeicida]|uniref:ABC transporter permease n=1 Tax=Vibrio penaeicida TaxID=104609 RepID=A0AAV5NSJ4_9VIBR|nr:ABC transporter permease [Vibrio penaeicida]RTZ20439.1 ABC transporter permease [Vibrio penaeicida]GLQ73601.1 ABC transporter permease [Vibrio penaeicida]